MGQRHSKTVSPYSLFSNNNRTQKHEKSGPKHRAPTESIFGPLLDNDSQNACTTCVLKTPSYPTLIPETVDGSSLVQRLKITRLTTQIERKSTVIDESLRTVLKYRTPHFRAGATVTVPAMTPDESIQIGWVQVCSDMVFVNTYGEYGLTSWEFPELVSEKFSMVSDSDGKNYPWYGSKHELRTLTGPCDKQAVTVLMNDNFFPQVTWYIPDGQYDKTHRLTHVFRKQHFYTFLVAKNIHTGIFTVMRTVSWNMKIDIEVHPELPLGHRSTLIGCNEQEQPVFLPKNISIMSNALHAPNANQSQVLVWRPFHGFPKIVVPPIETTVDISRYLLETKGYYQKLKNALSNSY